MTIDSGNRAATHTVYAAQESRAMRTLLFGLFFLSGVGALTYQTAWQRLLGAFVGSDSVGTTMIVGAFLFGLGIGSMVGGWFTDRLSLRSALRAFARCEIGVGIFACFTRTVFQDLFLNLGSLAGNPLYGWAIIVAVLLPPTILMGMSLPLLSRVIVDAIDGASARIGWLYGLNTLGAAAGAMLTGWVLIGSVGFAVTVYAAAAINVLIGLSAWAASTRFSSARPVPARQAGEAIAGPRDARLWHWPVMVFASGFLIISLEIVWFRVIGTLMRSDAYAFSMILGVFLFADAFGIIVGAEIAHRLSNPRRTFQILQGVMGLFAVGSLAAVFALDAYSGFTLFLVDGAYVPGRGPIIALALVFIPASLLGMSFPITQRAMQDDPAMVGRRVGLVQLCNILGNTAGAMVTGLVLLHWLGTAPTLRLIAVGCVAFCMMALIEGRRRTRDLTLIAALVALIAFFPANVAFWSALHRTAPGETAIVSEDRTGVAVLRQAGEGEAAHDTLFVVGDPISHVPFRTPHVLLGGLGALVHPDPQEILIIGQGTGGTPMAAGVNPKTRSIRVVEIVAPVFHVMQEAARGSGDDLLHKLVRDYYGDPRFTRIAGDARHLLLSDERRFDLIEADAIYPTTTMAGQLYSTDFFRLALSRLKLGGFLVQWVPTPRTLASVLDVFPYVILLNDFAVIASATPIDLSSEWLRAVVAGPAAEAMSKMGYSREEIAGWLAPSAVRRWTPSDPRTDRDVNTDIFPKDEYYRNTRKFDFVGR